MRASKYVIYARKSSEQEERQVQSVDDQVRWCKGHAKELGIRVSNDNIFVEAMSAKKPLSRPVFDAMIRLVEGGKADGIICWQINRLSRNPIDSARVQWLLQQGPLRSILTHEREYLSTDNALLFSVESGMANQFIIELRANTKRGLASKLEKGWKPGLAPIGYVNDKYGEKGNKEIHIDPERYDIVRKAWELMLSGNYNPRQIHEIATKQWGLTTRRSKHRSEKPISHNGIYRMLTNVFYTGKIMYDGQVYQGRHQAMISASEFDRVQQLLSSKSKPKPKTREFSYTGNITCGECGCMVTAETKTKLVKSTGIDRDYTYYRCTKRKAEVHCSQKPIKLDDLESQMEEVLGTMTILPIFRDWALSIIRRANEKEINDRGKILKAKNISIQKTQQQLDNLTRMRYSDMIEESEFVRERVSLQSRLADLKLERDQTETRANNWLETTEKTFEFACRARREFAHGDVRTKRAIFASLGQNAQLLDGRLNVTPNIWFQSIIDSYPRIEAAYNEVRTKEYASHKAKTAALTTVSTQWGE